MGSGDQHSQPDRPERVPLQLPAPGRGPGAVRPGHELLPGGRDQGLRGDRPPGRGGLLPRLQLERLQRDERLGLRPASEDAGPEGLRVDGQRHPHPRPPHPQGRDEDPPLAAALHRQQAVPGHLDATTGSRPRTRPAPPARATPSPTSCSGCPRQVRARSRPTPSAASRPTGTSTSRTTSGRRPPEPQPRTALRVFAVGLRATAASSAPSIRPRRGRSSWPARRTRSTSPRSSRGPPPTRSSGTSSRRAARPACPCPSPARTPRSSARASASPGGPFGDKTVLRGGYGIFFEQENTDGRVNNNMVPFRLDETGINDLTQRRTMADFFRGRALTTSAAPTLGAAATEHEDGPQPPLQPRRAAGGHGEHRARGELRREHRAASERDDEHQHPGPAARAASRRAGPIPSSATSSTSTPTCRTRTTRSRRRSCGGRRGASGTSASYTFSKSITTQNNPSVGGNTAREKAISDLRHPAQPGRSASAGSCRSGAASASSATPAASPRRSSAAGRCRPS